MNDATDLNDALLPEDNEDHPEDPLTADNGPVWTVTYQGFEMTGSETQLLAQGLPAELIQTTLLEQARQQALETVKHHHARALQQLSGAASPEERDTWPVQLAAAQAYQQNNTTPTQAALLQALLVKDETLAQLSQRIIRKDQSIQTLIGLAGGLKRHTEQTLKAATSLQAIADGLGEAQLQMERAVEQFRQNIGQ